MNLTDNEKAVLEIFTSDSGAYATVYKIAKNRIEQSRDAFVRVIGKDKTKSNEDIGAQLRAFDEGMLLVESIFRELKNFKKLPEPETHNPGR